MLRYPTEIVRSEGMPCVWIMEDLEFVRPEFTIVSVINLTAKHRWHNCIWIGIIRDTNSEVATFLRCETGSHAHAIKFCQRSRIREENGRNIFCAGQIKESRGYYFSAVVMGWILDGLYDELSFYFFPVNAMTV